MSSKLQIADNVYTIDNYSDKQVQINGFRRFSKNNDFYNNKNKHDLVSISIENEKITKPSTKPKFSFKRLFGCCCGKGDSASGGEVII